MAETNNTITNQPSFFDTLSSTAKGLGAIEKINQDEKNPLNINISDLLSDTAGGAFNFNIGDKVRPVSPLGTGVGEIQSAEIETPGVLSRAGGAISDALSRFGGSGQAQNIALSLAEAIGGGRENLAQAGLGGFIDVLRSGAEATQLKESLLQAEEAAGGDESSPISQALSGLNTFGLTTEQVQAAFRGAQSIQQQKLQTADVESSILARNTAHTNRIALAETEHQNRLTQIEAGQVLTPLEEQKMQAQIANTRANTDRINQQLRTEKDPTNIANLNQQLEFDKLQLDNLISQTEANAKGLKFRDDLSLKVARDVLQGLPDEFKSATLFGQGGANALLGIGDKPFTDVAQVKGAIILQPESPAKTQALETITLIESQVPEIVQELGARANPQAVADILKTRHGLGLSPLTGKGIKLQSGETVQVFTDPSGARFAKLPNGTFARIPDTIK